MQNRKPMVLVLAGPNGSGKSTITAFFEKVGKYTNADDIVASTGMDNMEAAILADKMRYESIKKKQDFTFETVLSSDYKMEILRKAKKEGYFIKCVFVLTIDPQINIARIKSRVAAGGHDVEKSKVIDRYYKSINNIKKLIDICDIMHVYDNTDTPQRIIRKHKEDFSIYPNEYWSEQDILNLLQLFLCWFKSNRRGSYENLWVVLRIQQICNTTRHKSQIYGLFTLYKRSQRDNSTEYRKRATNPENPVFSGFYLYSENLSDTFKTHENVPVTNR